LNEEEEAQREDEEKDFA